MSREMVLADKDEIIGRYNAGESVRALSLEYHVGHHWMRSQLGRWGLPLRDRADAARARARRMWQAQENT